MAATPVIRKVVPDTLSGSTFVLDLSIEDLVTQRNLDVRPQEVRPARIVIALNDVSRRTVRVEPRVTVIPDSGYIVVGGISVSPSTVTVTGPDPVIRSIRRVRTEPTRLTAVSAPVRHTVPLDLADLGPVTVTPDEVEIAVEVAFMGERVLMGVPIIIQEDPQGTWTADPPVVIVTVRGPSTRLLRLTPDSVTVAVVAPAGDVTADSVHVQVVAPAGIEATATPDTVVLTREQGE